MALANVSLTDTFDVWRIRTNQIIVGLDVVEINANSAFLKANQVGGAVDTANGNIISLTGAVVTANVNITAAFLKANQVGGAVDTANGNITAAFLKANQVGGAVTTANTNITNLTGAVDTANSNITAAFLKANQVGLAVDTANGNITAAFLKANNALANTSGVSFEGDLYFPTGNVSVGTTTVFYPAADRKVLSINGVSSSRLALGAAGLQNAYLDTVSPGQNTTLASATTLDVATVGAFPMRLITNSTVRVHVGINGNVGVGTSTANSKLEVIGDIRDDKGDVRSVPINNQTSAYVLAKSDVGKFVSITTGGVIVPNAVFLQGDNVTIYNNSSSSQIISYAGAVTTYLVGTANTTSKTLAQRGVATVLCVAANTFVITGGGLT